MQTVTVKLPDDLTKFLDKIAKLEERSRSYHIRKAIIKYAEDLADLYAAKQAMADFEKNPKTYSLEEIMRENKLSD